MLAVVDDDPDIRSALLRLLRSHGHEVHAFASAEAYLADDCAPDCAILDIQLPGISGLDLEGRLRETGSGTTVVFITAHDDAATREAIRRSIDRHCGSRSTKPGFSTRSRSGWRRPPLILLQPFLVSCFRVFVANSV